MKGEIDMLAVKDKKRIVVANAKDKEYAVAKNDDVLKAIKSSSKRNATALRMLAK